jgi:hypothetical protein
MNKFQVTDDHTLIYNLKQDGWHKGQPIMVNDCAISLSLIKQDKLRENVADVMLEALNDSYLVDEDY